MCMPQPGTETLVDVDMLPLLSIRVHWLLFVSNLMQMVFADGIKIHNVSSFEWTEDGMMQAAVEFGCRCRLICWLYLIQLHVCNAGDVIIIVNSVLTYICCILCHIGYSCGVMLLQQYNSVLLNVLLLIMLVVSVVSVRCNSRRWLLPHLNSSFP